MRQSWRETASLSCERPINAQFHLDVVFGFPPPGLRYKLEFKAEEKGKGRVMENNTKRKQRYGNVQWIPDVHFCLNYAGKPVQTDRGGAAVAEDILRFIQAAI